MNIPYETFKGSLPGKHLLVFGAIHGNETCGTVGIQKVIQEIKVGKINIKCGQVTFVPTCNLLAYEQNLRYIDEDLNRAILHHEDPKNYEEHIAKALCKMIDKCDALLDIHSMSAKSEPCVFEEASTQENIDFIYNLQFKNIFVGWEALYKKSDKSHSTEKYARNNEILAATVECGQHNDENAPKVAKNAILNALHHFDMIDHAVEIVKTRKRILLTHVFYKEDGGTFTKKWHHMQSIQKGEPIAKTEKEDFISPIDGFIIMPSITAKIDTEWYYLGQEMPIKNATS